MGHLPLKQKPNKDLKENKSIEHVNRETGDIGHIMAARRTPLNAATQPIAAAYFIVCVCIWFVHAQEDVAEYVAAANLMLKKPKP